MDNSTIGLIVTSVLLFVSELLPYLPSRSKGIVQSLEHATVDTLNSFNIPAKLPTGASVV
jgi:lipoate-protein ligase B